MAVYPLPVTCQATVAASITKPVRLARLKAVLTGLSYSGDAENSSAAFAHAPIRQAAKTPANHGPMISGGR